MATAELDDQIQKICAVSRETLTRLDHLVALVAKWSPKINLVSDPRPEVVWTRHVLDSVQLFPLRHAGGDRWCDLGSGGGFPGLVVALIARELSPAMRVALVESDRRKAAFLSFAARELDIEAEIFPERAEKLVPQNADTVSARALAPLPLLLPLVKRHLSADGVALLPKGQRYAAELDEARQRWGFTIDLVPSMISRQSRILRVTKLRSSDAA
jgi:16S rRNA (guanine527-N7)-methyltransferase